MKKIPHPNVGCLKYITCVPTRNYIVPDKYQQDGAVWKR
jgi:hypothetical protein